MRPSGKEVKLRHTVGVFFSTLSRFLAISLFFSSSFPLGAQGFASIRAIKPNETVSFRPLTVTFLFRCVNVTQWTSSKQAWCFLLSPPLSDPTCRPTPLIGCAVFFFWDPLPRSLFRFSTFNSPSIFFFRRLTKYVRSYGDRNNDLDSVSKCMSSPL